MFAHGLSGGADLCWRVQEGVGFERAREAATATGGRVSDKGWIVVSFMWQK